MGNQKLSLEDIEESRAYERGREEFLDEIIALKKRRRCAIGPFVTLLFENRDTVRFQIQEMARAEKINSDAGIQTELDIYNPLIPAQGQLCATLFLELTSDEQLRDWLPKLVGIERSVYIELSDGSRVGSVPDSDHEQNLTRDEITASVHYLTWSLSPGQVELFTGGEVKVGLAHESYQYALIVPSETFQELSQDLVGAPS